MEQRAKTSLFSLLFPTLIGLAFMLIVPIVSMLQIQAYHRRLDSDIDPALYGARRGGELAYQLQADILFHVMSLQNGYTADYERHKSQWQELVAKMPPIPDPETRSAWRQGVGAIEEWMQQDAEPNLKAGEQNAEVRNVADFRRGILALDHAAESASRDGDAVRFRLRRTWQGALLAETGGSVVCLLLGLMAWRNARALQSALAASSDSAARLSLAVKETNHRVKNNLQTIGALIDLNRQEHGDQVPRRVLDDVYQQVRTVAAVHDFLSHEHQGDRVDTRPLLNRLVELSAAPAALRCDVHAVEAVLPVKEATSVALITNELVLNAGKHGAKAIRVDFCREAESYVLRVIDDGPGLPPDFTVAAYANIGLTLVETLVRHDLNGFAHWSNHPETGGAQVEITFPLI